MWRSFGGDCHCQVVSTVARSYTSVPVTLVTFCFLTNAWRIHGSRLVKKTQAVVLWLNQKWKSSCHAAMAKKSSRWSALNVSHDRESVAWRMRITSVSQISHYFNEKKLAGKVTCVFVVLCSTSVESNYKPITSIFLNSKKSLGLSALVTNWSGRGIRKCVFYVT